jgi:hypothetical protein
MTHRDYALNLLDVLEDCLRRDRPLPAELRRYLLEVCSRVTKDDPDPLGIKKAPGRQPQTNELMDIARRVRDEIASGRTLADAVAAVAEQVGKPGSGSGESVEKAYRKFLPEIEAADRVHAGTATKADWAVLGSIYDGNARKRRRN